VRERAFANPHPESTSLDVTYTLAQKLRAFSNWSHERAAIHLRPECAEWVGVAWCDLSQLLLDIFGHVRGITCVVVKPGWVRMEGGGNATLEPDERS
jgi:hypothetical protein